MNDSRKILFVGGIPAIMTEDEIERHFSKICRVSKVRIMREKKTLEPKGFAFVTLADVQSINMVLSLTHVIEGRKVDIQLASRKGEKKDWKEEQKKKRIFVSNLPNNFGNGDLYNYFSKYGEVRNAYIIKDFMTDQSKNYGYIEFYEVGIVQSVLKDQVTINGHKVTCLPYVGRHEPRNCKVKGNKDEEIISSDYIYKKKEYSATSQTSAKLLNKKMKKPSLSNAKESEVNISKKYEFIGMSSKLNQDESNYRFSVSGAIRSRPGVRLPATISGRASAYTAAMDLPCTPLARYKMLKAAKARTPVVSQATQESVASPEARLFAAVALNASPLQALQAPRCQPGSPDIRASD